MANLKDSPKFQTYDQYYTPKSAWEQINHLIPKDKIVWEAFLLNSNQSKSKSNLKELGCNVIGDTSWDFLNTNVEHDLIVSNPPFSNPLKTDCLKRLVYNDRPFIIIMNSMNCFSNYFNDIFKNNKQHLQIIYPRGKIHFEKLLEDGTTELLKKTSFYCVYVAYKMDIPNDKLYLG